MTHYESANVAGNRGHSDRPGEGTMTDDERERTSYLTADELQAVQTLHKRAPYALRNVSMGFFGVAAYYGGCTVQGCHYTYMPGHDECVRDDVLLFVTKKRRKKPVCNTVAPQPMLDFDA